MKTLIMVLLCSFVFTQEICYFTLPNFQHFKEQIMQIILVESNDVHQIKTSDANLTLDYRWSDDNYKDIQVNLLH